MTEVSLFSYARTGAVIVQILNVLTYSSMIGRDLRKVNGYILFSQAPGDV